MDKIKEEILEEFDDNFEIGQMCNCNDVEYDYAMMRGKNDECLSCNNEDLKVFIVKSIDKVIESQKKEFREMVDEVTEMPTDGNYFDGNNGTIEMILSAKKFIKDRLLEKLK